MAMTLWFGSLGLVFFNSEFYILENMCDNEKARSAYVNMLLCDQKYGGKNYRAPNISQFANLTD